MYYAMTFDSAPDLSHTKLTAAIACQACITDCIPFYCALYSSWVVCNYCLCGC